VITNDSQPSASHPTWRTTCPPPSSLSPTTAPFKLRRGTLLTRARYNFFCFWYKIHCFCTKQHIFFLFLWYSSDKSQVHKFCFWYNLFFGTQTIYIILYIYIQEPEPTTPTFPGWSLRRRSSGSGGVGGDRGGGWGVLRWLGRVAGEGVVRMVVGTVFGVGFLGASQVLMVFGVASRHIIKKIPKSIHCSDFLYCIY